MQYTFTLPDFGNISTTSYLVAGTLLAAAIMSSATVELYKRHYFKKNDIKLVKHWTAALLTAASIFFTYLGYAIFLASSNSSVISALPYVGKHFATVLGICFIIYNFRTTKWYLGVTSWLGKWSKSSDDTSPIPAVTAVKLEPIAPEERVFNLNG